MAGALPGVIGALAGKRLTTEQKRFLPEIGVVVALALVVPIALELRAPPVTWVPYASSEGGFHATFPGVPQAGTVTAGPPEHPISVRQFVAHWETPSLDCVIAYIDYAKADIASSKPEEVLANARDGAAKQGQGKVTADESITVGGYPAKAIKIEQEVAWVYSRLILANERLYVVTVATPAGVPEPAEVGTFFESFTIER